jgi:hypothetical protein
LFLFSAWIGNEEETSESIKTLNQITVKSNSTLKFIQTSARKNSEAREKSHKNENFIVFMLFFFFFRLINIYSMISGGGGRES